MWTLSLTLAAHCTENSKQIFPEIKERGLVPNFCIHVSVNNLYIPPISRFIYSHDRSDYFVVWEYINRSQIHECRNWVRGHAVSFPGIFVSNFSVQCICSADFFKELIKFAPTLTLHYVTSKSLPVGFRTLNAIDSLVHLQNTKCSEPSFIFIHLVTFRELSYR
jgi:hypothetical protein